MDGLELVASLYILAQRRAGRRPGLLPWAALLVGTAASLAANVAVGGHDPVGRALAGWPAVSLLVSIKLLFSMFDHGADDQRTVRADQRSSPARVAVPSPRTNGTGPCGVSGTTPAVPATQPDESPRSSPDPATVDIHAVAGLVPAARAARLALADHGRSLSRDALADRMRDDGYAVSNARASQLLKILRSEGDDADVGVA